MQWKNQLVDYDNKQHRLGYAKEVLKERICGEEYYELEDEYAPNLNIYKKPREKPWETEPDFLEFIDEDTGYRCFIQRHPELKHLCGYVELPKEHELYGSFSEENFYNIEVHGGVTYTGRREFEQPNYIADYVLGFDCGHAGDYSPYFFHLLGMNRVIGDETYKDIEYVINECKNLAKQLKELE